MDLGLVCGVVGVVGIPAAIGLTMAASTHGEFRFVRGCFLLAALLTFVSAIWLTHDMPLGAYRLGIVAIAGAMAAVGLSIAVDWVREKEAPFIPAQLPAVVPRPTEPPIQDVSILADCSDTPLPMYVPADGRIMDAFAIFNDDVNRVKVSAMNYQGKPGEPLNWFAAKQSPFGWKCELTAQQPVFDAVLALDVTIIENIRKPDPSGQISNYSGMPIGRIKEIFSRHRINSNSNVFYLVNQSSYFVNIEVQGVASGGIINKFGGHERRNDIPVNTLRHASMGPFIIEAPPTTTPLASSHQDQAAEGGKGGSGEVFGNNGTIIGGKGGNVGPGGVGRGGDGGGGVIHGDRGTIIGGEGGSVDGTNIWFPPAQSGYIQYLESQGQTPDFDVQYPGAGGASAGWLQHQQIIVKIREGYFKKNGQEAKIRSSKIEDVPLEYINEKLKESGYSWRARIEKKYWYLYYVPAAH